MSYPSSKSNPDPNNTPATGFSAQSQMGLAEVLQMCCLSRRSGQITFRSGPSYGFVYIQHGRVLHALCGPIEGAEAIYVMLSWPGGGFSLDEDILPHKKTITLTWEQLLFEGARRADSEGSPLAQMSGPVTTAEPVNSSRAQESQPKLTVTRPDLPPLVVDLVQEYTHVGRISGNEICLPYPSISSRHCIFVLSGGDIVLRDLNSSNGTLVNGESITETVLRPGDVIQAGVVQMKFEPGIKRPKLTNTAPPPAPIPAKTSGPLVEVVQKMDALFSHGTVKLPTAPKAKSQPLPTVSDSSFVKGESAISYENLPKPEEVQEKVPWMMIIGAAILLLGLTGGSYYYFFVLHGAH